MKIYTRQMSWKIIAKEWSNGSSTSKEQQQTHVRLCVCVSQASFPFNQSSSHMHVDTDDYSCVNMFLNNYQKKFSEGLVDCRNFGGSFECFNCEVKKSSTFFNISHYSFVYRLGSINRHFF